jgi:lysophospholipase L1-like esterase
MSWIRKVADAWLILGITIALFVFIEFFGFLVAMIHRPYDSRANLPVYKTFDKRVEFWREHEKTWYKNQRYSPYHLWNRKAFSGRWHNVDANGVRVTHYNADEKKGGVKKIFMFGGSTLWGTGAADWETISSYLAKFLNKDTPRNAVYNYGETGYVSSQGLNRLISEIKIGNIPDLVIFYEGINDAFMGAHVLYALKTPSYHTYMDQFEKMFEGRRLTHFLEILKMTYIYQGMDWIKGKLLPKAEERWAKKIKEAEMQEAVHRTVKYLISNYKIASSLGKEYGFRVILCLQPNIYCGKKILQEYEKKFLKTRLKAVDLVYGEIKKIIEETSSSGIYDLSDVFETIADPIYIDWAHIGPLGNYHVAQKIGEIIKSEGY